MKMKASTLGLLIALAAPARAETTSPTWIVQVTTAYAQGPGGGLVGTTTTTPATGLDILVAGMIEPRTGTGSQYDAIVDWQAADAHALLLVDLASNGADVDPSHFLTLCISAYTPSDTPPNLTSPPVGTPRPGINIPLGDYSAGPLLIDLGGPGAYILSVACDEQLTLPAVILTAFAPVPEPSSLLLLATGLGVVLTATRIRRQS